MKRAIVALSAGAFALGAARNAEAQGSVGFGIRSWVEWDDQRIELGQAHVSGPYGLQFTARVSVVGTEFTIRVTPRVTPDSTGYFARIEARQPVDTGGSTPRLFAIDQYTRTLTVGRDQAAELNVPYQPEPGETATLKIHIDGPFAPTPRASGGWADRIVEEPRGVRYGVIGYNAGTTVRPEVCPGGVVLRVGRSGSGATTDVLACGSETTPFPIPGIEGLWSTVMDRGNPVPDGGRCFALFEAPPARNRGVHRPGWTGTWCFRSREPGPAATVTLPGGALVEARIVP